MRCLGDQLSAAQIILILFNEKGELHCYETVDELYYSLFFFLTHCLDCSPPASNSRSSSFEVPSARKDVFGSPITRQGITR